MSTLATTFMTRVLYGYWRSSASYRVRIALNLKGLNYEHRGIHLVKNEQQAPGFLAKNPQGLIPLYVEKNSSESFVLAQSLAILDYLDETYPQVPLLPADAKVKAQIRAAAQIIACEIHPLDNLRVLQYLQNTLGVADSDKMAWYRHWVDTGLSALESRLPVLLGDAPFSLGEHPGYLEALVIPQLYNARRFDCSLHDFPRLLALDSACQALPAFQHAAPENQPDAT